MGKSLNLSTLFLSKAMVIATTVVLAPISAHAFGKSPTPTPPPAPSAPAYTLPNPMRAVFVQPFQNVYGFTSPNNVTTTLAQAQESLDEYLATALPQTGVLQGAMNAQSAEVGCGKHLELWPAVLDFEMNALQANITFGFNSTGTINVAEPTATVSDTISLGDVSMGFILYECDDATTGSCTSLLSSQADQGVLGNQFTFNVSWTVLSAGGDIFSLTDLGTAVTQIIASGMKSLVSGAQMSDVPWSTTVAAVNSDGSVTIDAGETSGIGANQYFEVYAATSDGACGVNQALGCIATSEVSGPSSVASVYRTLSTGQSRPIQAGDIVEVGSTDCAP